MNNLPALFTSFMSFFLTTADPCDDAKAGAAKATEFAKNVMYSVALNAISHAFQSDGKEHAVSFGTNEDNQVVSSGINSGDTTSGTVPVISNAFADLHNHPNNTPPNAGDLYGLIDINKNRKGYVTRYVVTPLRTVYALLITDTAAAFAFNIKYPRQPPAYTGGPPGFPTAIVDEFREMKYQYNCTDEMAMAFILEKCHSGVSLLKQDSSGSFKKLRTIVSRQGSYLVFIAANCH